LSYVDDGVRALRNSIARVIDALRAGRHVAPTVRGEPIADIVAHGGGTRWLSGTALRDQLGHRCADPGLRRDLHELAGETLADL
jgi:antitoxin (DNA-binding transcriptional repressor) of toxin-antitoxin stability system